MSGAEEVAGLISRQFVVGLCWQIESQFANIIKVQTSTIRSITLDPEANTIMTSVGAISYI
jgi:hypothetical protein